MISRMTLVALAGLLLFGCSVAARGEEITINGHVFTVEVASSADDRQRGLMFREELDPDAGMLFVFPDTRVRSFWMRNTSIPLSIAYIAPDGTINEIYDMQPHSLESVESRFPAQFALEVNQGRFRELGIEPGDRVDLTNVPY